MRVAILAETFARNTSYFGVMFPKYLARLGVDVHLLVLDLPPYWNIPAMRAHYESLVGREWLVAGRVAPHDGYTVHVMAHQALGGLMRMRGLAAKLREIRPDVVYSLSAIGWIALEAACLRVAFDYKLFTGSHTAASTFPLYRAKLPWYSPARLKVLLTRALPGRLVSLASERCYGPTVDCAEIAWRFFGVERDKVGVMHLGVDTDVFYPVRDKETQRERAETRSELGIGSEDILTIYTGKLTEEKNVALLVHAVEELRRHGMPYQVLVIGEGPERERLSQMPNAILLPYQPYEKLGKYYRAADIGVWPTNESTSMLDAAACGLPLIVSDGIIYREHVEGNGIVYRMNDRASLTAALARLSDARLRRELGVAGAVKMARDFSWVNHARRRLVDYERAIGSSVQAKIV